MLSAQAKPIIEVVEEFEQSLQNLRPSTRRVYVAGGRSAIRAANLELWQCPSATDLLDSLGENCLKIDGREVLLWDTAIEEPCFAISLRFWHAWRERLAKPEQRRLYRKSLQWSQSGLLFPGPNGAPLSRAALHNALRRLDFARPPNSIEPITPEKIRAAFL